jgi:phosphomevalonate kinase
MSDAVELSAPGKAFVAGEYSVLQHGEPALVLAVDIRMHATVRELRGRSAELVHVPSGAAVEGELTATGVAWVHGPGAIPGELRFAARSVELAVRLCAEEGLAARGFSMTFLDDLSRDGHKLGLGGSAAASVLAVRAACLAQQREVSRDEVICLAATAHWLEQGGRGSGADVAACASGGLVEVRSRVSRSDVVSKSSASLRDLLRDPPVEVDPVRVPRGCHFLLAWTGQPADSRKLVDGVMKFASARQGRWHHHVRTLSACEVALREALERGDEAASLDAVRRAAAALPALGDEAQVPIVTQELARACAIASSAGAAGKPSGAGGGDCAIVLAWGDAAERARKALEVAGYLALEVAPVLP